VPASNPRGNGKAKALNSLPPAKTGKVRFHEEVQVRNIKAKGKNRPLFTMYEEDDDDDDDDDDEYGEQMTFDDFEAAMDGVAFEEDEDEKIFNSRDEDNSEGEEVEDESEEGDGRDTMARLKDDLFADDEEPQTGS